MKLIDLTKVKQVWKSTVAAGKEPTTKLGVLGIEIGQEQSTGDTSRVSHGTAAGGKRKTPMIRRVMEGKTYTAAEMKDRNADEAQRLAKKMVALAKRNGIHVGHVDVDLQGDEHVIIIENSEGGGRHGFSTMMEELVRESKLAKFVSRKEYEGRFDWKADTYIKPASEVRFKF